MTTRRHLLAATASAALVRPARAAFDVVRAFDPAMAQVVDPAAPLERVYDGGRWCEGPGRLNAPNDLALAPDGAVWFTDPTFGLIQPDEGRMDASEQPGRFVFRLDRGGRLDVVADSFEQPNGIVFSPDRRTLYVSDTSASDGREGRREIRAFDVQDGRRLTRERVFATLDTGVPDGLDVDRDGRVYAACGDGVRVWDADGRPLGRIATASACGNLAFGGADRRRLFLCTGESIQAIDLRTAGPAPTA